MKHGGKSCIKKCSAFFLAFVMVFTLINVPSSRIRTYAANSMTQNAGITEGDEEDTDLLTASAKKKYTITYKLNGGKNSSKNPKYYYKTTPTIKLKKPTKKGYTFSGWYKDSKFKKKVTQIKKGSTGKLTLYAKWKANSYTISFYGNGSESGSTKKMTCKYGKSYKLSANGFKKTGYKLAGWTMKQSGSGKVYKNKASVKNLTSTNGGKIKFYAKWSPIAYQVVFDANGGTGTMDAMTDCRYDMVYNLTENRFTRQGMVFKGWNTKADGSGTTYLNMAQIQNLTTDNASTITLYAQWMESGYIVSFNANGGSGSISDITCKFGTTYNLPANTFSRLGCEFTGWNTKADGSGTAYADQASFTNATQTDGETVILYAQWKESEIVTPVVETYTVIYAGNASGVVGTMENATYKEGETITFPQAKYTRTGYVFYAWNAKADGTGKTYKPTRTATDLAKAGETIVLYAQWTAARYTIKYNANGGSGTMSDQTVSYDVSQHLTNNAFVRDGYEFVGWTTASDGSGQFYDDGQAVKNLSDTDGTEITLYAKWEQIIIPSNPETVKTYTIKYSANGTDVNGSMNQTTAEIDGSVTLTACGYTRTGYEFTGWNTKADGSGTAYSNGEIVKNIASAGSNVTLYAQWKPVTYTIQYDANGGTGSVASTKCTYDSTDDTLAANGFVKSGYTFIGWNTKADGSGVTYAESSKISNLTSVANDTITLYAQWKQDTTEAVTTYKITFNANGGSGTMLSMTCYDGVSYTLSANVFTKDGYYFAGWNTKADGSGTSYLDGASVAVKDNMTLYAQWKQVQTNYTILFNANGGSGSMSSLTAINGVAITLTANQFTRTDYTFKSWNTKADGSGTTYSNKASVTDLASANGSVTLYAQWTKVTSESTTYTVKFDGNGASSGSMSDMTVTNGVATVLTKNSFTRNYYTFKEWNTKANGSGTSYTDKETVTDLASANGSVTLYAIWTPYSYTVKFDANGGTGSMSALTCEYSKNYTLPTNTFVRSGYEFAGWNTKAGGSGTAYAAGASVSKLSTENGGQITLYAQWKEIVVEANTYVITYNANGDNVTGTMANQTANTGEETTLSANSFTRKGYVFAGWNTKADGKGNAYADKASVKDAASAGGTVTLYAQWTPNTYTVAFMPAGGSGTMGKMTCTYGESFNLTKNTFTREGYEFSGWKTASGATYGDGELVSNLTSAANATIELYAQWTQIVVESGSYTVMFDGNGEDVTGTTTQMSISVNASKTLTACGYSRPGYTFAGWNTKADGSGTSYGDKASVSGLAAEGETITLYATWTAIKYKVAFDGNGGTGTGISPKSYTYGKDYNLPVNTSGFSKEGYTFTGWNTKADGSGTAYADGATVSNLTTTAGETVTLYAQWILTNAEYTIVFDANGGAGTMDSITKKYGESVTLTTNVFTKVGYTFGGWMLSSNGKAADYQDGATITNPTIGSDGKVTLYAYWVPITYYVHFNKESAQGGGSQDATLTCKYGQYYTLEQMISWTGYKVVSWCTAYNLMGTFHSVGSPISNLTTEDGATVELYPKWKVISYKVNFRVNHSSVTEEPSLTSITLEYGQAATQDARDIFQTRANTAQSHVTGATFVGWNTAADGSGTWYYLGKTYEDLSDKDGDIITLYAQWN